MIKVTEGNTLLLLTNISFGSGHVSSVININESLIALCIRNGIDVYNKKTKKLTYKIPKHKESHDLVVLA